MPAWWATASSTSWGGLPGGRCRPARRGVVRALQPRAADRAGRGSRRPCGLSLPTPDEGRVRVRPGVAALEIDRERQCVVTAQGDFEYDHLVLATGARGGSSRSPDSATGFPRRPRAAQPRRRPRHLRGGAQRRHRRRIGGGPLGIELACGLQHRGVKVTVMSIMPTMLDRDLDASVAQVAEDAARTSASTSSATRRSPPSASRTAGSRRYASPTARRTPPVWSSWPPAPHPRRAWPAPRGSRPTSASSSVTTCVRPRTRVSRRSATAPRPQRRSGLVAPGWAQPGPWPAASPRTPSSSCRRFGLGDAAQGRRHERRDDGHTRLDRRRA